MNIEQVKTIIASGEGSTLEFKKSTGQLSRAMETLCGMLNNDGGHIFFEGNRVADRFLNIK